VRLWPFSRRDHQISAFTAPSRELLPLALTPLCEPHAHLEQGSPGRSTPMATAPLAGALAANQTGSSLQRSQSRYWQRRRGCRGVGARAPGPCGKPCGSRRAWCCVRPRLGRPCWTCNSAGSSADPELVALVPGRAHWGHDAGPGLARRLASRGPGQRRMELPLPILLGGVLGRPSRPMPASEPDCRLVLRLADELGLRVTCTVAWKGSGEAGKRWTGPPGARLVEASSFNRHSRDLQPTAPASSQPFQPRCWTWRRDREAGTGRGGPCLPPTWFVATHGGARELATMAADPPTSAGPE